VKDRVDSWEQHFDKISIEEQSKFDEETLYNLEGIKRKKTYSRKPDGFRNEYIVVSVLLTRETLPKGQLLSLFFLHHELV
jgi:uncharacterized membrane protein